MSEEAPKEPHRDAGGNILYPAKPGDWVQASYDPSRVAKVKDVHWDPITGEYVVDLYLFDHNGERRGRESPAMGGPRTWEPACSWNGWNRIEKPDFPIKLKWVPTEEGAAAGMYHSGAKVLPDRSWAKRQQTRPAARPLAPAKTDYNPEIEAASRRLAAEEMREIARRAGVKELAERAAELEREADAIAPRGL